MRARGGRRRPTARLGILLFLVALAGVIGSGPAVIGSAAAEYSVSVSVWRAPRGSSDWAPFTGVEVQAIQDGTSVASGITGEGGEVVLELGKPGPTQLRATPPQEGFRFLAAAGALGSPPMVTLTEERTAASVSLFFTEDRPEVPGDEPSIEVRAEKNTSGIRFDEVPVEGIDSSVIVEKKWGEALAGSPISSIPISSIPISSIPISSIPISSIAVQGIPISSIPISSIPISSISWDELLAGTGLEGIPSHKVTLRDILDLEGGRGYAILAQLTLRDADFRALGLGRADIAAVLLGAAPISSIDDSKLCNTYAGSDCDSSLLALQLSVQSIAGAPISSIPISSIPISSIPISSIPISSIPISSIPISSIDVLGAELAGVPISSIDWDTSGLCANAEQLFGLDCDDVNLYQLLRAYLEHYKGDPAGLAGSPISSIPISSIPISSIPISSIPISSIPISSIPISSIDTAADGFKAVPISSIDFSAAPISSISFADVEAFCARVKQDLGASAACEDASLYDVLYAYRDAGIALKDSPFQALPISSIPISSIPISSIPISSIPISSIPISSIPISSIPISSIEAHAALFSAIPISSISADTTAACAGAEFPAGVDCGKGTLFDLLEAYREHYKDDQAGLAASPISSIPISSIPISSIPISSIPISSIPISSIALDGTPISSIPISSIPISSITLDGTPISSIPISSIQIKPGARVSIPISSISALKALPISSIPISSIDVLSSPISSIKLGELDLSGQPVCRTDDKTGGWVEATGQTCAELEVTPLSTLGALVRALAAEGVAQADGPLKAVPISSIPTSSIPLSIPISSIDLASVPISSIPISSITVGGVPISSIRIDTLSQGTRKKIPCATCATLGDVSNWSNSSLLLGDIEREVGGQLNATLDFYRGDLKIGDLCTKTGGPPGATLDDTIGGRCGASKDAARPEVTLGELIDADESGLHHSLTIRNLLDAMNLTSDDITLFLGFFLGEITIGDLYAEGGDLGELKLAELLAAMVDRDEYPWEELDLASPHPAKLVKDPAKLNRVTYHVEINSALPEDGGSVTVTLPEGFLYVDGSDSGAGSPSFSEGEDPQVLTWSVPGSSTRFSFDAYPGLRIGKFTATVKVANRPEVTGAEVEVLESFEPNSRKEDATPLQKEILYVGHISSPTDVDYFELNVPGGHIVSYFLSHFTGEGDDNDNDLRVEPSCDTEADPVTASNGRPADCSRRLKPLQEDVGRTNSIAASGGGAVADGAQDGTSGESGAWESPDGKTTTYHLKVSGYNGSWSPDPYVLRVRYDPIPEPPVCSPLEFEHDSEGIKGVATTIASDVTTLLVVNKQRLGDAFGAGPADIVIAELEALVAFMDKPGIAGKAAILYIDGGTESAYEQWDENPCDPESANEIVVKINELVDAQQLTGIENLVLVGGDELIPFFRSPDPTLRWNEKHYAGDIAATGGATWGALTTQHILTDAAYGDLNPRPWLDRYLFLPDIGVGRLVETPDDIAAQLKAFVASEGLLAHETGVAVGYDFLADGAKEVLRQFEDEKLDPADGTLINETWTGASFIEKLGRTPAFHLASLNAHFDHHQLLTAADNQAGTASNLVSTADLPGDGALAGSIVFSMGCHAGLNLASYLATSPADSLTTDWAQVLTANRAIFVANTGFGYGDTEVVGLTERLMSLFAGTLLEGSRDAGQALTRAQLAYIDGLGQYGVYDEKTLMQATFYGLPMYRLGNEPGEGSNNPPPVDDSKTGLKVSHLSVTTGFEAHEGAQGGAYWSAIPKGTTFRWLDAPALGDLPVKEADTETPADRPYQPRVVVDITQEGLSAHGAIIERIEGPLAEWPVKPEFAIPDIGEGGAKPPVVATRGSFPSRFQTISPSGVNLVLNPGQFSFTEDGTGFGFQRLFELVEATVYYHAANTDFIEPEFPSIKTEFSGAELRYAVSVVDRIPSDPLDEFSGEVRRVLVLQLTTQPGREVWQPVELVLDPNTGEWSAPVPAGIASTENVYFVQAVDASGNVAAETNKGAFFSTVPEDDDLSISLMGSRVAGTAHRYSGAVWVKITGPRNAKLTYALDGGGETPYGQAFVVSARGPHVLTASDGSGNSVTESFFVEAAGSGGRRIEVYAPVAGTAYPLFARVEVAFECIDFGSGIADCGGDLGPGTPLLLDEAGMETLEFFTKDGAGRTYTQAVSYTAGDLCRDLLPTIIATAGVDTEGTPGNDIIRGTEGDDVIRGNGGNDIICSFGGNDTIETGSGNDYVESGSGNDVISDAGGHNLIRAGSGNDKVTTGQGDDYVDGGLGDDELSSGAGNDTLTGGIGGDSVSAGPGLDDCGMVGASDSPTSCERSVGPWQNP